MQFTRSYSQTRPISVGLISLLVHGKLEQSFETALASNSDAWKSVKFIERNFMV